MDIITQFQFSNLFFIFRVMYKLIKKMIYKNFIQLLFIPLLTIFIDYLSHINKTFYNILTLIINFFSLFY